MVSIEQCKKILEENNETYTNEEIRLIREFLYNYSHVSNLHRENKENDE